MTNLLQRRTRLRNGKMRGDEKTRECTDTTAARGGNIEIFDELFTDVATEKSVKNDTREYETRMWCDGSFGT